MSPPRPVLTRLLNRLPPSVGGLLGRLPRGLLFGPSYRDATRAIRALEGAPPAAVRAYLWPRIRHAVAHAWACAPFYRELYAQHGLGPDTLRSWEDLQRLPIVTKADLQAARLEARSCPTSGRIPANTGGTSGSPLQFYVDRAARGREWAHMLHAWRRVGYRPDQLKLTFRGVNLGHAPFRYGVLFNEYLVNTYLPVPALAPALRALLGRRHVRFLHGYPSTLYDFALACREQAPDLLTDLKGSLRGVLLASEYPAPRFREAIEAIFQVPTLSWYGHSEKAIYAFERERYVYRVMHSYGYAEAVPDESGRYRLVATSPFNDASPFIRYDTGDLVDPEHVDGLLVAFRIAEGRVGEFVVDRSGKRISLTALIYGRHHALFDWARFLQVRQPVPGEVTILVTPRPGVEASVARARQDFDGTHVDLAIGFEFLPAPIRASSGKVTLLVP